MKAWHFRTKIYAVIDDFRLFCVSRKFSRKESSKFSRKEDLACSRRGRLLALFLGELERRRKVLYRWLNSHL